MVVLAVVFTMGKPPDCWKLSFAKEQSDEYALRYGEGRGAIFLQETTGTGACINAVGSSSCVLSTTGRRMILRRRAC
jgi:hypothetical protein